MITSIITVLDAAATGLNVATRYGLAELIERDKEIIPAVFVGGKDFKPIASDLNGSWSYWRMDGKVSIRDTPPFRDQQATVPLRFVALIDRELCEDISATLASVGNSLMNTKRALKQALNLTLSTVEVVGMDLNSAFDREFGKAGLGFLPTNRRMISLEVRVAITAKNGCLPACDPPVVVTVGTPCQIIQGMTAAGIDKCLTDQLRTDLIALLT